MRAVVQRVSEASVTVDDAECGAIGAGLLVYLGVAVDDTETDVDYLADKVAHLRVFPDESARLNLDATQVGGGILVVSAFTVQGDVRRGRRPSFDLAAPPDRANELYEAFCAALVAKGLAVERGRFRAAMQVRSVNDGPICVLLDSRRTF